MRIAVDAGNSTIAFGVFDEKDVLLHFFKLKKSEFSEDDIALSHLKAEFSTRGIKGVKGIYISSVAPSVNARISTVLQSLTNIKPEFLKIGCSPLVDPTSVSSDLGSDIYANCVASRIKHPSKDVLLVDFGTASTIVGLSSDGKILGVSIAAGVYTNLNAICQGTELLNQCIIDNKTYTLGTDTPSALVSGVLFSAAGMVECALRNSRTLFSTKPVVIATGGVSKNVSKFCTVIDEIDENITVYGILKCFH